MSTRNPFEAPPVRSRRGGRVKEPLSRDAIVAAALDLLKRDGLEGMSLRKVAAALDTGPATLYAYVEDHKALQALVLDRALSEVVTGGRAQPDWRGRLMALLESYFTVLTRTRGLAPLAMNAAPVGPNALRILEAILELFDEAGMERATAAWGVDLVLLYVTAIATEVSARQGTPYPLAPMAQALGRVSAASHPMVQAHRELLLSGDGPDRFAWAVEVLLNGILETPSDSPRPAQKKAARRR
jgi:AcrR family transcriptional regulator